MTSPRPISSTSFDIRDLYFDQLPADLRDKMASHQGIAEAWIEHARLIAQRTSPNAADKVSARGGAVSIHDVNDGGSIAARPGTSFVLSGQTRPAMGNGPLQVRVSLPGQPDLMVPVRPDGSWSATVRVPAELQGRDLKLRVDVPTTTHGEIYAKAGVDVGSALVSLQADDAYFTKTLTLTKAPRLGIELAQVRDPELRRALEAYDTVRDGVITEEDLAGAGANVETTLQQWDRFVTGERGYKDASAALAIALLESSPKPISGAAMRRALVQGVGDPDARAASTEFAEFDAFVRANLSPENITQEAAAMFLTYRNLVEAARERGHTGLPAGLLQAKLAQWDKGNA